MNLSIIFWKTFILIGFNLYRKIVDLMLSLSDNYQAGMNVFNSTSRYLDDLLNIDNAYFKQMVGHVYSTEFQLNKDFFDEVESKLS